jgi:hypothetical protein
MNMSKAFKTYDEARGKATTLGDATESAATDWIQRTRAFSCPRVLHLDPQGPWYGKPSMDMPAPVYRRQSDDACSLRTGRLTCTLGLEEQVIAWV